MATDPTPLAADAYLQLLKATDDIREAMRSRGIPVSEEDSLAHFAELIRDYLPPSFTIFRSQQFADYRVERFPPMSLSPDFLVADLNWMFGRCVNLKSFPVVYGFERAVNLENYVFNCPIKGDIHLPSFPQVGSVAGMFQDCRLIERLTVGDLPVCTKTVGFLNGCISLVDVEVGELPKVIDANVMFYNCSSLKRIVLRGGIRPTGNIAYCFSGDVVLQSIEGVIDVSEATSIDNIFYECIRLEEVRIKGLRHSIGLNRCHRISAESLRYLIDNAQVAKDKTIYLSRSLMQERKEEMETLGRDATAKGYTINYQ